MRNLEPHQQTPVLWPLKWPSVGQYVFKVPGSETEIDDLPSAVELTEELNPYQGLEPFTQQESNLFFGRDELTNELIDRVKNDPLTVVTGASGSGKSSLVRAGLIPKMKEEPEWLILPVIRPLGSLSQALTPLLKVFNADPVSLEKQGIRALEEPWRDWVERHAGHRCLLVIDQFEEMITQWQSERDVSRAIHLLREAQIRFGDQLHIVFTVRADFEASFRGNLEGDLNDISKLWTADKLFRVRRMNQAELRDVILKPAAARTLFVDSEVVDGLVEEVFDAPGALPLLSFTLKEMYRSYVADPDGTRELTGTHHENVGGIHGALPIRAESLYQALSHDEKTTLRHVMLRMVTRDAGELVRRRVPRSELTYPGDENKRATAVLKKLQEARLVVTDKAVVSGKMAGQRAGMGRETASFVEPAHDALIRSWKRLGDWVKREDQREDDIAFQRRLTGSAKTWYTERYETPHIFKDSRSIWSGIRLVVERAMVWRQSAERKGHLYDDASRSDLLAEILDRDQPWFNSLETEFTRASIRQNRINTQIMVWSVVGFICLAVVILLLGLVANNRGSQLLSRGLAARAEAELSQPEEADPAQALALAYEAILADRSDQAERALSNALFRSRLQSIISHEGPVRNATFNQDGTRIATTSGNYAHVWRWHEEKRTEGRWIQEDTLTHFIPVKIATFSPDGSRILTAAADTAYVWSVMSSGSAGQWKKEDVLIGHPDDIRFATFNPDGSRIATTINSKAYVWQRKDEGRTIRWVQEEILEHWGYSYIGAVFSPDGSHVLTANSNVGAMQPDSAVYVWRWHRGQNGGQWQNAQVLGGHPSIVRYTAFSPDGSRIVTVSNDPVAYVWKWKAEKNEWEREDVLLGHPGLVERASFSSDGTRILTESKGNVHLWRWTSGTDTRQWEEEVVLGSGPEYLTDASFSEDGSQLLAVDETTVKVWKRLPDGRWKKRDLLEGHSESIESATFNPEGTRILTGSSDEAVRIWSVGRAAETAEYIRTKSRRLPHLNRSRDRVLTVHNDSVHVWRWDRDEWRNGKWKSEGVLDHQSSAVSKAFLNADGSRVLTMSGGVVRTWRWQSKIACQWSLESVLTDLQITDEQTFNPVLRFGLDGSRLLNRSGPTVNIWQLQNQSDEKLAWVKSGTLKHSEDATDAWFSPEGLRVVTSTYSGVHIWRWEKNENDGTWTKESALDYPSDFGAHVAFVPDGSRIVLTGGGAAQVWRRRTINGKVKWEREESPRPEGSISWKPQGRTFNREGLRIIDESERGSIVNLWKWDVDGEVWVDERIPDPPVIPPGPEDTTFFSSDGSRILNVRDNTVHVWTLLNEEDEWMKEDVILHPETVDFVDHDSDRGRLVTLSDGVAKVWEIMNGTWQLKRIFGHPGALRVVFSQDGSRVISLGPGSVGMHTLEFRSLIQSAQGRLPTHLDEVGEREELVGG